jgi:2-(1,2-epoxy-1,2-dihydrophenyl)acetyl-CoA isomerase
VDPIVVGRESGLMTITLNRPDRKNALNGEAWIQLDQVLGDASLDPEVRAVQLTGAGGNFSAGADLSGENPSGNGLTGRPVQPIVQEMRVVGDMILRLQRMAKPTIAKVDGVAVGVGLGLALACDLVVASDRARFSAIFAQRGLALDGGVSWILPRIVGLQRAKELCYFADVIGADDALTMRLVNRVVPVAELDDVADGWARRLASGPTLALSLTKRLLNASSSITYEQALEDEARCQHITATSHDMLEGIGAWTERRAPQFQGR